MFVCILRVHACFPSPTHHHHPPYFARQYWLPWAAAWAAAGARVSSQTAAGFCRSYLLGRRWVSPPRETPCPASGRAARTRPSRRAPWQLIACSEYPLAFRSFSLAGEIFLRLQACVYIYHILYVVHRTTSSFVCDDGFGCVSVCCMRACCMCVCVYCMCVHVFRMFVC